MGRLKILVPCSKAPVLLLGEEEEEHYLSRFPVQVFPECQLLITSPLSNLIKVQADHHLSTLHVVHIGEKPRMTTLLSEEESLETPDNVILLLIHSSFPHVVKQDRNSDNTNWPVRYPVINQCWHANIDTHTI